MVARTAAARTQVDTPRTRAVGAILGMACGDALGAQVEFRARDTFRWQKDMTGAGPHHLKPGQWTDDTAMALALGEHLLVSQAPQTDGSLMDRWVSWWRLGEYSCTGECFDIGTRTLAALSRWARDREYLPDHDRSFGEGNGAVMRVAPVGVRHWSDPDRASDYGRAQGLLTHGRTAAAAAGLVARIVARLVRGDHWTDVSTEACELSRDVGARPWWMMGRDEIESGGHCLDTLEAALWCVDGAADAESAICAAVNLGHDADTTAAVAGAIAGARWGLAELPVRWTRKLAWTERLTTMAEKLAERGA